MSKLRWIIMFSEAPHAGNFPRKLQKVAACHIQGDEILNWIYTHKRSINKMKRFQEKQIYKQIYVRYTTAILLQK